MPVKLIGTILLLIFVTIFSGINIDNKCDVSFLFYTFKEVPVFMTVIISFVIGIIVSLPFAFSARHKSKKQKLSEKPVQTTAKTDSDKDSKTLFDFKIKRETKKTEEKPKKSLFARKAKKQNPDSKKAAESEKSESAKTENSSDFSQNSSPQENSEETEAVPV